MSTLEKRHTSLRGSMQGHHKYSDGFSDTSSSSSFMDETDREVSNLTDRAFRSLCIGEEAIYNDSEFSSPTERHKAFAEESQQKTLQRSSQETFSCSVQQYGEAGAMSEMASTFQHSYVDASHQEQAFREESFSYMNNGSKEMTWQQSRSTSRVSSLIKAFSSGESYHDSGAPDVILTKERYRDESWDKSALLSIQKELSEFSSSYHQNFRSGPFQTYRNHFYTSEVAAAVAQMDTTALKSSKSRFKALNSTNCFFHSEFSPFQLWEDYNRFPFASGKVSGFMSSSEFPRWYDSPLYKELKDTQRIPSSPCDSRHFNQRQIQDVVPTQRSRSTVIQKAFAIEKRCESEMASNCPPWKKSNNFMKNKLPSTRPSTVSPTNEKTYRPDSSLFSNNKVSHEVHHKVEKVIDATLPSNVTPFNITQLLTPVIHTRQETETSEILQFAHTPSVSDYSSQGETDPKSLTDVKHLRDNYKSRASSLLFNLKDNRKRVKSTYSPTKFKGLEITDRNKQTAKMEGRESRFSDILVSQDVTQENFIGMDTHAFCNQIQEPCIAPIPPKDYADGIGSYDPLTFTSTQIQDGPVNYKSFRGGSEGHVLSANAESTRYELSSSNFSTQDKTPVAPEGQFKDLNGTFSPTRPEIANMLPPSHPPAHSLLVQTSEKQKYGLSDDASQNDLKQKKDFGRKPCFEYSQNEAVKERCPRDQTGSENSTGKESLDKHRKATAKQYLPSANDGYSVRKETYLQKVNEDIKLGRLANEEKKEDRVNTTSRRNSYNEKPVHGNDHINTLSKSFDSYGIPKIDHQNKELSPLKEVNAYGVQNCTVKNDFTREIHSERGPEQYTSANNITMRKTSNQSGLYTALQDNKSQKNEGFYQPYKYDPNKQWHMASREDKHTKDTVWTQKQSEKTAQTLEQTGAKSYSHKISNTLSSTPQSTLLTTTVNQHELSNKNSPPKSTGVPEKDKLNIHTSDQNNSSLPREDRFSINDILSIRDNQQAKRIKENKYSSNAVDLAKSENALNQFKYDITENKTSSTEAEKGQEQKAQWSKVQGSPSEFEIVSPVPGYLKNDFYKSNEGLAKVTTKALSYKERGQTKQEILTSKLKAHAQKEISAIKEKGLAKQGILGKNVTKPTVTPNNEKPQDGQEVQPIKKEITADKLNHLFQDITYSSVTQYNEQLKIHNDYPKHGSLPLSEKQSKEALYENNQTTVTEKKNEYMKHDKPSAIEKQNESDKYDILPAEKEKTKKQPTQMVQDKATTVAGMKNQYKLDDQKSIKSHVYQPNRTSEDVQLCRTSSENICPKEELANQSIVQETLSRDILSGSDLTSLKSENYTSRKPPVLHGEKETNQPDQREKEPPKYHLCKNEEARNLTRYTDSEQAQTKPTDIYTIKKNEKPSLSNTENLKANNDVNKISQKSTDVQNVPLTSAVSFGSDTTRANEQHKSGIKATEEQSETEQIKHNNGISVSELMSSLSDMKLKNGIPPDKPLMTKSAKSELLSKHEANTEKDGDFGTYKHNCAVSSDVTPMSLTENIDKNNTVTTNDQLSQRTNNKETVGYLVNKDGGAIISKNNKSKQNDSTQQHDTSQVKAIETTFANKTLENQLKSRTNEEALTGMASSKAKESCQQKEADHPSNTRALVSDSKNEPIRSHYKSGIKVECEEVNNNQQSEGKNPKSTKDSHSAKLENTESPKNSNPKKAAEDLSKTESPAANASTQHTSLVEENTIQKNNIQPLLTQDGDSTGDESNVAILKPGKEEPEDEPMIYSIYVSSKTEAASDDEPMIFTISVSSKCHTAEQQNPVKEDKSSADTELSAVKCEIRPKEESVCIKNDSAMKNNGNESPGHKEIDASSNNNKAEEEHKIKESEQSATMDKHDHHKSSETGSISTSYENLLAKYGLPVRDYHLTSKQHIQDKKERNEKEDVEVCISEKANKHEINRSQPSKEKNTCQEASGTTQHLKESENKIKQQANGSAKEQHTQSNITSNKDISLRSSDTQKQQIMEDDRPKHGPSTRDFTLIPKDKSNAEQQQDAKNTVARQSRKNGDIQSKDDMKVEEQVQVEKMQRLKSTENSIDDESNSKRSPNIPMKIENVHPIAKQLVAIGDKAKTTEVLKTTISEALEVKGTVYTKLNETGVGRTLPLANRKPQRVSNEGTLFNHTSDTLLAQNTKTPVSETFKKKDQKVENKANGENRTAITPGVLKKESVSTKDAQTLQNSGKGEFGEKKAWPPQEQVKFNTSNEITDRMKMVTKNGAATHANNYSSKVSSNGKDVCTAVKQDQTSFEVARIHLEDTKVSTKQVSSNNEFMPDHKKRHEMIKTESLKNKGDAVLKSADEKDFVGQKKSPVKSFTGQNDPERMDNMKHTEMASKLKDDFGNEITPPKKDSLEKTSSLINIGEDKTSESEKKENLREGAVWTKEVKPNDNKRTTYNSDKRRKEDAHMLGPSGHVNNIDGDLKVNENESGIRANKDRNVETMETKQANRTVTNQNRSAKGFVAETKGNASDGQGYDRISQKDMKSEDISSKPEATPRGKKVTRPEISAIADYARLKVISVEDEDLKEINMFPQMDFFRTDQSVLGVRKDLHANVPLSDLGKESKKEVISAEREKSKNLKQKPLQFQEREKETFLSQKHNDSNPSMSTAPPKPLTLTASGSEVPAFDLEGLGGTQGRALTNHKESNNKTSSMEHTNRGHHKMYPTKNPYGTNAQLQAEGKSSKSRQLDHDKTINKDNPSPSGRQESSANLLLRGVSGTAKTADNQISMVSPVGEEMEELQYYTVNALENDLKAKETAEPSPASPKMTQNKEEEKKEESVLQSLTDNSKVHATGSRSNSSSPALGKPTMFRVKDNTIRTSSVTKTVKPRFHRSFSDDLRIGSPRENLSGSEKGDEEHIESANPPTLHEPATASHRLHKVQEIQLQNNIPVEEYTANQSKSHQRRSQILEQDEIRSVISTMSENVENSPASIMDFADIGAAYIPRTERYRDTYQRPASACYERPESSCYERPESACSDIRPFGKPPVVPPKSEKALRRAQRLTTRRMKKTETTMTPENQEQPESKSIGYVSSVPSSPSDLLSTRLAVQATPPLSQYSVEPKYTTPARSMVAQPFPMTQRKLLQDPNSGQYFMVDVPLPVKTKTFYDPETGKYVQLNVRQRPQGALTQPTSVEMLNAPYMLYPGFLPMAASSLPPLRSSSQMSAPATLTEEQDKFETGSDPWRQNVYMQNYSRDSQQYPELVHRSHERIHDPSLFTENNTSSERHTDIITMSELEDFAMENT